MTVHNNDTVTVTDDDQSVSIEGDDNAITANGSADTVVSMGDASTLILNGTNAVAVVNGTGNDITVNTGDGTVQMYGDSNSVTVNGAGTTILVSGSNDVVDANTAAITVADSTTGLTVGGFASSIAIGNDTTATLAADQLTATLTGSTNFVTLSGNAETVTDTGIGNTITLYGHWANVAMSGDGGSLTVDGSDSQVTVSGTSDAVEIDGVGSQIQLGGRSNTLDTTGSTVMLVDGSEDDTLSGGANTITVGSSVWATIDALGGDTISVEGADDTLGITDSYTTTAITGSGNQVEVDGTQDQVTITGFSNTVTVEGTDAQIAVAGQSNVLVTDASTISVAAGAQLTLQGMVALGASGNMDDASASGNIIDLATGVTLAITGGNNWLQASGTDTVTLTGPGNGVGATAGGNTVILAGTGDYTYVSDSTITVQANGQAMLTGDRNVITAGTGTTLVINGSGNTLDAAGATLSFDGAAQPATTSAPLQVRGFAFPASQAGDYNTATAASSLTSLKATGANAVELVVTQYVSDADGNPDQDGVTIAPSDQTASDADLIAQIQQSEADGLQVLFAPHIDPADGTWRALLTPEDPSQFFANYETFIVHYAQIAQQMGVATFSIGAELQSLTGAEYRPYWLDIIQAVRQVYSGELTYASAAFETGTVSFWDKLDIIGANAYERLTTQDNPTLAQLEAGWTTPTPVENDPIGDQPQTDFYGQSTASDGTISYTSYTGLYGQPAPTGLTAISPIEFYQGIAAEYGKPVLFTEAGYASVNATNRLQGDGRRDGATYVDDQQQSLALQASLTVWSQDQGSWLQGAYLWSWNPNPDAVTTDDSSIQGKPALAVVEAAYGGTAASPSAVTNTVAGDGNTITAAAGERLTLSGSNNTVVLNGARADYEFGGAGDALIAKQTGGGGIVQVNGGATLQFTDGTLTTNAAAAIATAADFSDTGMSDLVLQNVDGTIAIDLQANLALTGTVILGNPGPDWHVVASADFNGDGKPDVLLQNTNGQMVDYLMDGTAVASGNYLGDVGPAWHVRGTGDFNGDGRADLVLQNDDSGIVVFNTDGTSLTGGTYVGAPGAGWTVEGVADFNGDGQPDILLQNTDGAIVLYAMSGAAIASASYLGNPGVGWAVAGTGDYNGDGKADILLHNDAGADVVWDTDGSAVTGQVYVGNPGASYTGVVGGVDLNGDKTPDLLVQDTNGTFVGYTLDVNATITAGAVLGGAAAGWRVLGQSPTQTIDGTASPAGGTLVATPGVDQFDFTAAQAGAHYLSGFDPAQDSVALSQALYPSFAAIQVAAVPYQGGTFLPLAAGSALVIQGVAPTQLTAADFVSR